jgi:hypothetical protein
LWGIKGTVSSHLLDSLDFSKRDQPGASTDLRRVLIEWSIPPVELSVLGLFRHMTQMEHVFLGWGLGGGERVDHYGDDDYAGGSVETIDVDLALYLAEVEKANASVAALPLLDSLGVGHGRPLGATLVKMIDEYALHSGQAHMLRYAALGEIIR